MSDGTETIGVRLRARRRDLDLTQDELAKLTGISQAQISAIERGASHTSADYVARLAVALSCSTAWLLTGVSTAARESDLPHWQEFLDGYERLGELTEEDLADMKQVAARRHRIRTWTDYVAVAEWILAGRRE